MGLFGDKIKTFEPLPADSKPMVSIELEGGDKVKMELYPDAAPQHVASFVDLVEKGYYDGLKFHRVVSGFVVQGGCPKGTGTGGPGYAVKAEFNSRPHFRDQRALLPTRRRRPTSWECCRSACSDVPR